MRVIVLIVCVIFLAIFFAFQSNAAPVDSITTTDPFVCSGPITLNLLKISINISGEDALVIGKNCTGTVKRVEIDTWAADGIKVQNAAPIAHDLRIGSGYVTCHDKQPAKVHQDAIQAMGGTNITFVGLHLDCPFSNSDLFINKAGSLASTPTGIICSRCYLGPHSPSHTATIGESVRSGLRDSTLCPDRTPFDGAISIQKEATSPILVRLLFPKSCV